MTERLLDSEEVAELLNVGCRGCGSRQGRARCHAWSSAATAGTCSPTWRRGSRSASGRGSRSRCSLLLWIIVFPLYLFQGGKVAIKTERGYEMRAPRPGALSVSPDMQALHNSPGATRTQNPPVNSRSNRVCWGQNRITMRSRVGYDHLRSAQVGSKLGSKSVRPGPGSSGATRAERRRTWPARHTGRAANGELRTLRHRSNTHRLPA